MKKTFIMLSLAVISWGAQAQHDHSKMEHSEKAHSQMKMKMGDKPAIPASIEVEHSTTVTAIINNYLDLKNALAGDDGQKAATSGKQLMEALSKFEVSSQSESQQTELSEIIEDAQEQAEHISENSGKTEHQREHFETLSTDLKDLIVIAGSDRNLFQTFCPMANNNEGAMWLSESREIRNPYLGTKMTKCGSIQQEIRVK